MWLFAANKTTDSSVDNAKLFLIGFTVLCSFIFIFFLLISNTTLNNLCYWEVFDSSVDYLKVKLRGENRMCFPELCVSGGFGRMIVKGYNIFTWEESFQEIFCIL